MDISEEIVMLLQLWLWQCPLVWWVMLLVWSWVLLWSLWYAKGVVWLSIVLSISWPAKGLTMTGQWPNAEVIGVISIMSIRKTESR